MAIWNSEHCAASALGTEQISDMISSWDFRVATFSWMSLMPHFHWMSKRTSATSFIKKRCKCSAKGVGNLLISRSLKAIIMIVSKATWWGRRTWSVAGGGCSIAHRPQDMQGLILDSQCVGQALGDAQDQIGFSKFASAQFLIAVRDWRHPYEI